MNWEWLIVNGGSWWERRCRGGGHGRYANEDHVNPSAVPPTRIAPAKNVVGEHLGWVGRGKRGYGLATP